MLDLVSLPVLPLVHLVRSLLHSQRLFLLLRHECLEKVTLGFDDQLLAQFRLVIFSADPLLVRYFTSLVLQAENLSRLRVLVHRILAIAQRIYGWSTSINLLTNEILHVLASGFCVVHSHHFSVVSLIGYIHIIVHTMLLHTSRLAGLTIHRKSKPLQQLLVLLEKSLIVDSRVEDAILVRVTSALELPQVLLVFVHGVSIVQFQNVLVLGLEFVLELQVDQLRVVDTNGSRARLHPDDLVDQVHGLSRQLDQVKALSLVNFRVQHESLGQFGEAGVFFKKFGGRACNYGRLFSLCFKS